MSGITGETVADIDHTGNPVPGQYFSGILTAIPTGIGIARNNIVTNSDAVIAIGGGAGTLSEIALAWQKGKLILALKVPGWSGKLAETRIDDRAREGMPEDDRIIGTNSVDETLNILMNNFVK